MGCHGRDSTVYQHLSDLQAVSYGVYSDISAIQYLSSPGQTAQVQVKGVSLVCLRRVRSKGAG